MFFIILLIILNNFYNQAPILYFKVNVILYIYHSNTFGNNRTKLENFCDKNKN